MLFRIRFAVVNSLIRSSVLPIFSHSQDCMLKIWPIDSFLLIEVFLRLNKQQVGPLSPISFFIIIIMNHNGKNEYNECYDFPSPNKSGNFTFRLNFQCHNTAHLWSPPTTNNPAENTAQILVLPFLLLA